MPAVYREWASSVCTIAASRPNLSIYLCVKHEKLILIDPFLKGPINCRFCEQPYMTQVWYK